MDQNGFTLVEMLVALAIFAVISAAGVSVITYSLREGGPVAAASARLEQLQIARTVLRNDFGQITSRAVRGPFGEAAKGGFQGGNVPGMGSLLTFVRGGWKNPGGLEPRSSLQFVAYVVEDGELRRISRPILDPTPETPEETVTLLTGVENLRVTFYSNGRWIERWVAEGSGPFVPAIIAIDAQVEGFGPLRQLFVTPGAT